MKKLILFRSKYGTTHEYAKALHGKLKGDCDICDVNNLSCELKDYDLIIIGSCTYMGRIMIADFLKQNIKILKKKKLYLFAIGLIPADSEASKQSYEMISPEIRERLSGYRKFPGRILVSKLNFFERMILKMTKAKSENKVDLAQVDLIIKDLEKAGLS